MKPLAVGLRSLAILLAIAGVIDPELSVRRPTKPVVSLIVARDVDPAVAGRVEAVLASGYTVIPAPFATARATVIVGETVPEPLDVVTPVFAVLPDQRMPTVAIVDVSAPAGSSIETSVLVTPTIEVDGAIGHTVDVSIMLRGRVIDRATQVAMHEKERLTVPLSFVPTVLGTAALRIVATVSDSPARATADIAVDVIDKRWAILFFDRRPSWISTFVRRAVASDRRFSVSSRVTTSTSVSTTTGRPPLALDDSAAVQAYDAIVVGAAEDLTDRDVNGLDRYLRQRGGSVVLLLDDHATESLLNRLTQVGRWVALSGDKPLTVRALTWDGAALRAAELLWPATLPTGGAAVARDTLQRPIIWRMAVGAGQLTVSGALDAWRYRDTLESGFDRYWRTTVADAAAGAASALQIDVPTRVIAPGSYIDVHVTDRGAALAADRATHVAISGTLVDARGAKQPVRLWPAEQAGQFRGSVRAPNTGGDYRIRAADGVASAELPIVVLPDARPVTGRDPEILDAYLRSNGGRAVRTDKLDELTAALAASVPGETIPTQWYPMRSGWWIVPLVFLLGGEWWWRRRHGLS